MDTYGRLWTRKDLIRPAVFVLDTGGGNSRMRITYIAWRYRQRRRAA